MDNPDIVIADESEREPTDAERELTSRHAFAAAYEVVRGLKIDAGLTRRAVVATTYRAMVAAQSAAADAVKTVDVYVDITDITASAWALHLSGDDDMFDEWSPESAAGEVFMGFASACMLLKAHSDYQMATGEYDEETSLLDAYAKDALNALPTDTDDD